MKFLTSIFILLSSMISAQNLFPNSDFELYNNCPTFQSQITYCTDMDSGRGTADYYNCGYYANSSIGPYGIPKTGTACVGLVNSMPSPPFQNSYYGELVLTRLTQTLIPGATYNIQADILFNSVGNPVIAGDCFDIGFYFVKTSKLPSFRSDDCINVDMQVRFSPTRLSVNSYTTLDTNFVADSCYDAVVWGLYCNDSSGSANCKLPNSINYLDFDNIIIAKVADAPLQLSSNNIVSQEICTNDCINFQSNGSPLKVYYQWLFEGGNPTISTDSVIEICYSDTGFFDITLISNLECKTDTLFFNDIIKVNALPFIELNYDTALICMGEVKIINAISNASISWHDGSTGNRFAIKSNELVIVMAENNCGKASDSVDVEFENCPCSIFLPSAFTPDNDELNDEFKIAYDCIIEDYNLLIYNRWGQQIFSSNNKDDSWNGTYNKEECPAGIYVAYVKTKQWLDGKLKNFERHQSVSLIR